MAMMRTETPVQSPPTSDKGKELIDYRVEKLIRGGYSPDIANEIANTTAMHDSDFALKALSCVLASGLSGFEAEETAMYLIGLRDRRPQKFNLN